VEPGSSAAGAGIQPGDVIVDLDGNPVRSSADLRTRIGMMQVGSSATLGVLRNGERRDVVVEVGARRK
jgi:S1-C subfamily serine protease